MTTVVNIDGLYLCTKLYSRSRSIQGSLPPCPSVALTGWFSVNETLSIPCATQISKLTIFTVVNEFSGVARSLELAGHLLYASPLASLSRVLHMRSRDMSGTNVVLWPGTCPDRPDLCYATQWVFLIVYRFVYLLNGSHWVHGVQEDFRALVHGYMYWFPGRLEEMDINVSSPYNVMETLYYLCSATCGWYALYYTSLPLCPILHSLLNRHPCTKVYSFTS